MKILVLGGDGMLGHKVVQVLSGAMTTYATYRSLERPLAYQTLCGDVRPEYAMGGLDVLNIDEVASVIDQVKPVAVVNCVGIVKQRDDAKEAIPSILVNALFPHQLANLCEALGTRLIHLSTDCVFSGNRGQYTEDDVPDPADIYGRTKLLGELNRPGCLTLRTSIIGWELKHRASLLEWFATQRGRTIKGYRGAIYTGLSTAVLGRLIKEILEKHCDLSGLYHVASSPISKYDLLVCLRDRLGWNDIVIEPDDTMQCDRSLVGARFVNATGWRAPTWEEMIADLAAEWPAYAERRKST